MRAIENAIDIEATTMAGAAATRVVEAYDNDDMSEAQAGAIDELQLSFSCSHVWSVIFHMMQDYMGCIVFTLNVFSHVN